MKLTCSKDLLLQYINIVNKAVSNRTTLPILECILLTANERGFIMTGNDLETGSVPHQSKQKFRKPVRLPLKRVSSTKLSAV